MKSEKDIIDDIIARLKEQPDRGYREGAWENFKQQRAGNTSRIRPIARWSAAAAVLLLVGVGSLYYVKNAAVGPNPNDHTLAVTENKVTADDDSEMTTPVDKKTDIQTPTQTEIQQTYSYTSVPHDRHTADELHLPLMPQVLHQLDNKIELPAAGSIKELLADTRSYSSVGVKKPQSATPIPDHVVLAAQSIPSSVLALKEVETINQHKQFNFGDKFDLGLFVSPQSTGQKTNIGGGLTLAYNLTNKISVRTGASYNSYEVGLVKNPMEAASAEAVVVSQKANDVTAGKSMVAYNAPESNRMIMPNINAVTSVVQSLDVPLEIKYNVAKSFYAVAGVSYSAILNQERNAHYVDNVNMETFSKGFPEDEKQMKTAVAAVSKTVKSADKNVSTNGFNGFVNFSIGKKVKINNHMGVSVEPYFKVPVGQYRRADMDYTNGGIRVMTNF